MRRLGLLVLLTAVTGCGGAPVAAERAPAAAHFAPVLTATPAVPPRPAGQHLVAALDKPALLRGRPGGRILHRLGRKTEFGSPAVLSVADRRPGWLRVRSAALPNHHTGWIPAGSATLQGTDYAIHVDRSARRARLTRRGRTVLGFPVAVGRPGNETPTGHYAVTDKLRPSDPTSPYGCCAVALTGHQTKLVPGWPGGDRLAIHSTPATWSIGEAVSLGCMRASRQAMERLMRRLPLGTPVVVEA